MKRIDDRRYRIGVVSQAVGLAPTDLRTQIRRGYIVSDTPPDKWDRFSILEVCAVAAMQGLTNRFYLEESAFIVANIVTTQTKFWNQAIELAMKDRRDLFIYVVTDKKGVPVKSFLYAGRVLDNIFKIKELFEEDLFEGEVVIANVGGDICRALDALEI